MLSVKQSARAGRAGCVAGLVLIACTLVGALGGARPAAAQARGGGDAVAIVVHPDVDVETLSFAQLRKIFLGEQQYWGDRRKITLLVRAPEAYERDVVLRRIYEMSEDQYRQYWIAKIFRSELTSGPKVVYTSDMAGDLVVALPGSITFMRAGDVQGDLKVVRVDGKLPGEAGYPLR